MLDIFFINVCNLHFIFIYFMYTCLIIYFFLKLKKTEKKECIIKQAFTYSQLQYCYWVFNRSNYFLSTYIIVPIQHFSNFVASLFHVAAAIKCFQCNSKNNAKCVEFDYVRDETLDTTCPADSVSCLVSHHF
jgi:hypothetical protein